MHLDDAPPPTGGTITDGTVLTGDAGLPARRPRLAAVLRMVLEHLDSGAVVAATPAEVRLALRLQGALAAFDVSSRVWSDPLPSGGDAG
ncbi:MAG TPA: hypothetical protein VKX24_10795 [Acidimicrobiia bacterium]|nr:hypothetical protein [Acidimicrobiia bacterium]HZQ77413.1 hypothetical protein [Acidimicrobiia bacterium]